MSRKWPSLPNTFLILSAVLVVTMLAAWAGPASPGAANAAWLQTVQQRIAEEEYRVTWQSTTYLPDVEEAWHAPNRAHDLRTYFSEAGPRVIRRTESEPTWQWGLSLVGYGRGRRVWAVDSPRLSPGGNRIDYERGSVVEWYVNAPRGLEQGFTLWEKPETFKQEEAPSTTIPPSGPWAAPVDADRRAHLAYVQLALTGDLRPVFATDGEAIDFEAPRGARVLHYAHLKVTDAGGRELAAWMESFTVNGSSGIRIVFDDREATYPVTVDPLATSPAWTAESDQADAWLGRALSTAGDVDGDGYSDVIVGAPGYDNGQADEGRVFVFHGSPSGLSSSAAWTAEGDQLWASFGAAVSTAGDVDGDGYSDVLVGAPSYDNGQNNEGAVFAYLGSPGGLSSGADWTAEGDQADASFGASVSAAGDVNGDGYADVLVGADRFDAPEIDEGRAFLYLGSSAGPSATADWTAECNLSNCYFAGAVSTAGDVDGDGHADILIGARGYSGAVSLAGGAFLYLGSSGGPSSTPDWTAEGAEFADNYGASVSTAGDVNGDGYADIIVGAYNANDGENNEGRAFVYFGSTYGPSATEDWSVGGDQIGAALGRSVSTAGDVNGDGYADVIVGADSYDNVEANEGRAFAYFGSATGLSTVANWTAESDQADAAFGSSAATAGDVNGDGYSDVLVGAHRYDNGQSDEGRAYVYHGSASGLAMNAAWAAEGNQVNARFGVSVSTAGDVDGDGYSDVIVGADWFDNGEFQEGRAFVYHGSASGLQPSPGWTGESNQGEANFGRSVSTAGDVNGDGYADVIVGAPDFDNGESDEGRAHLYYGSASGLQPSPGWTGESNQADARFGYSVSTAGDVNGDGYSDVIVGASYFDNVEANEGRAYAYHGSAAGLQPSPDWTAESDQALAYFGFSVSGAGDVNGDGYADVIVGAPFFDNGQLDEGRAYLYHGSAAGLQTAPGWTAERNKETANFGFSVSTAGDVNGDGYSDVIVGAYYFDNDEGREGRAFVYHGSINGLFAGPSWIAEGNQVSAFFGNSVSTAGDVNGDGYADVTVGSFYFDNGQEDEGRAYVYHGSATGLQTTPDWTGESDQAYANFGSAVSTAGDVNGDGYADVIVGAVLFHNGEGDEGGAFVYYGNDGEGLSLEPRQRRADDLAPIADGGRSREPGRFRLAALGSTPFGRGRVKLQWEVKPQGQAFDGIPTGRSAWLDTGTDGAAINELISGLEPGRLHWRLRLLYDPVTVPLAPASRWFTVPWNGWEETDLFLSPFVGGKVWNDGDADGIMKAGESPLVGVVVHLIDDVGTTLQTTASSSDGTYRFEIPTEQEVAVRFVAPSDWIFTLQDQGVDDFVDSDADTATGETTLIWPPQDSGDETRWSAGLRRAGLCFPPDETVYLYTVTIDANDNTVLHIQDPNQPDAVTGYNIYRSSDPGLPHAQWPRLADDVVDMDQSEPNVQYVDTTGDPGTWYYQVAPFNHGCPQDIAEGPW